MRARTVQARTSSRTVWGMSVTTKASAPHALLVEPQALFAPYFVATLERAGFARVDTLDRIDRATLRGSAPDVVVIDAGPLSQPLRVLRVVRAEVPRARIVIFAHRLDAMWATLARSLGADAVIGPTSDEAEFFDAVAPGAAA